MRLLGIGCIIAFFSFGHGALAQCSDAGACSIGRRPADHPSHSLSLSYMFGRSAKADDLTFHTVELAADVAILEASRVGVLLPFMSVAGPLGTVSGIGDLTVIWSQNLSANDGPDMTLQAGIKIALADVNSGGLPQAYQSGLGTTDVLLGAGYRAEHWNFAFAYQVSPGRSGNRQTRLKRGDDILLRAGYANTLGSATLSGEILFVKRLRESSILTSPQGQPEAFGTIPGSDQTQLNIVARASAPLQDYLQIRALLAIPLLKRDINVDGLTRSVVLSAGLAVNL